MRRRIFPPTPLMFLALSLLLGCGGAEPAPQAAKDLVNFTLPPSITEAAPMMQDHLYRVVSYNSSRHKVKPIWVFLDGDRPVIGNPDPLVTRLNLLHLAYWEGERLLWSGSLMHPAGGGGHVFSSRNYEVSLRTIDNLMKLRFRDQDQVFEHTWPTDMDHAQWLTRGNRRLYVNLYVFPQSLVNPHSRIPEGATPTFKPSNIQPLSPEALEEELKKRKQALEQDTPPGDAAQEEQEDP